MARTLDEVARLSSKSGKLSMKTKEKALMRIALFELYFMDNSPRYAIGQEMGDLAKKYCHPTFAKFLNALLRNLPDSLPEFKTLGLKYSYPDELVTELLTLYPFKQVEEMLRLGNLPAETQARIRPGFEMKPVLPAEVAETGASDSVYIMNRTPAELIQLLAGKIPAPRTILDLCASPGGKLLALHDIFPDAKLFANDISAHKMERLFQNIDKYKLDVDVREGLGEDYTEDSKFDLVVLDVPCSNTGVFAKHPEARWRTLDLEPLQKSLLEKAKRLTKPGGNILYMTCSLLKRETPQEEKIFEVQIIPATPGQDGGYGAILQVPA